MAERTALPQNVLFTVSILSVTCLMLLVSGQWAAGKLSTQGTTPQIINQTATLQVENLTVSDGYYVLHMRNSSGKSINGYTIGVGARGKLTVDLTVGDRVIAPGDVTAERIPISNLEASSEKAAPQSITILAVLFTDGTGDGSPQVIAEVKDRRAGARIQLKRILSLIQASLTSPETNRQTALDKLKMQIDALSEEPEAGMSSNSRAGLRSVKEDTLARLQGLEQSTSPLQEELIKIKESIEKRVSRL